ncbi:kinetochore Sim4 complex subunit FTA2-domain-containing protein [Rhypophila decipiens]|uniref:Kinetochore Sim4 complex subunit FTA2-domain-containing protein n=1 Tax=Rhypophila decipiens TaxID=261697 RepID=A0AAN7B2Y4_9PEZI|nr:kinetochore Sim4 complex subunit FTA2-domain-containing protein [Rhypophila decipiens]
MADDHEDYIYPKGDVCDFPVPEEDMITLSRLITFPRGGRVLLPPCERPKLYPFRPFGKVDNIEWVHEVAVTEMSSVRKVRIDEQFYALKAFEFLCGPVTPSYQAYQRKSFLQDDPFHCECRAYSRLKETNSEHLVVACHGYVLLTPGQESVIRDQGSELPSCFRRTILDDETPVRALFKDWVDTTEYFVPKMVPQMLRDIKAFNSLGIINRDIKMNNYLGGKQFDFGVAWTVPHLQLDNLLEKVTKATKQNL